MVIIQRTDDGFVVKADSRFSRFIADIMGMQLIAFSLLFSPNIISVAFWMVIGFVIWTSQ